MYCWELIRQTVEGRCKVESNTAEMLDCFQQLLGRQCYSHRGAYAFCLWEEVFLSIWATSI